jgi:recombination protein RecA
VANLKERLEDKKKGLDYALAQIRKRCGDGAIMTLGKNASNQEIGTIPTGSLSLDMALGTGGMPRGRISEIYGPESSGKTTLTLHIIANAQKNHGVAAFIDAEHALDPSYARKLGVDLDSLLVSQPDYGEQALDICEVLIASGGVDVIVVDSVAALTPKAEIDGEIGDRHVGLQARMMSQAMRKLTSLCHKTDTALIFINQIREKIGVMFGSPETTTGGRALKFYASVRLDIRRSTKITSGDQIVGNRTIVKVVKNKMAPPFRKAEFDILFNKGISWIGDVLDRGVEFGIVRKSGSWYSFGETRIGQGRERTIGFLEENRDVLIDIEGAVLAHAFPPVAPIEDAPVESVAEKNSEAEGDEDKAPKKRGRRKNAS